MYTDTSNMHSYTLAYEKTYTDMCTTRKMNVCVDVSSVWGIAFRGGGDTLSDLRSGGRFTLFFSAFRTCMCFVRVRATRLCFLSPRVWKSVHMHVCTHKQLLCSLRAHACFRTSMPFLVARLHVRVRGARLFFSARGVAWTPEASKA